MPQSIEQPGQARSIPECDQPRTSYISAAPKRTQAVSSSQTSSQYKAQSGKIYTPGHLLLLMEGILEIDWGNSVLPIAWARAPYNWYLHLKDWSMNGPDLPGQDFYLEQINFTNKGQNFFDPRVK